MNYGDGGSPAMTISTPMVAFFHEIIFWGESEARRSQDEGMGQGTWEGKQQ